MISIKHGYRGPNFATVLCLPSSNAIIDALNYIRLGHADVIVTGGSEAGVTYAGIGGFNAMHALSLETMILLLPLDLLTKTVTVLSWAKEQEL